MCAAMTGREAYRAMFRDYPDVVTVEQMSRMLGISDKTAYALLRDNKIEHFKVGRTYKIPKIHILSYLKVIQRANEDISTSSSTIKTQTESGNPSG